MKTLVLDNYDSFTYNLVHIIENYLGHDVDVFRNDEISLEEIEKYDKIILSPGPGIPDEAGILKDVIRKYASTKSIFGVCLGEQAIAEVFGGELKNLTNVHHGVSSKMIVTQDDVLFNDVPKEFEGGRYHSWIVSKENLPDVLKVTCEDEEGAIMAIRHKEYDVSGVQFHPESVLTEAGSTMIENFLKN
ncbi:MAG: aminodeoxychorismate/anthranilate synthase component II [Ichthyobacteriaceae bacterium]|nr:aminodeoxychorismate/anthranilate synthase component II [Ichthyobacteriaceae bacterium]